MENRYIHCHKAVQLWTRHFRSSSTKIIKDAKNSSALISHWNLISFKCYKVHYSDCFRVRIMAGFPIKYSRSLLNETSRDRRDMF